MPVEIGVGESFYINRVERLDKILQNSGVSFDIDQVDVNSANPAISELNRRLNTNYEVSDIKAYWGLADILKKNHPDINDPMTYAINLWNDEKIMANSMPLSGALILSQHLAENGVDGHRITSRPAYLRPVTLDWYRRRMPWVKENLIHIQDGESFNGGFKVQEINKMGIGFHFEDSWEQAEEIAAKTKTTVVLVPQPWNLDYKPKIGSRIIKTPRYKYQTLPKMIQVYMNLADLYV